MAVLELNGVSINFGGLVALKDVSFQVGEEILGLIGPNGAGKTTLINCITGVYKPTRGEIRLGELLLNRLKPYQICRAGVARTFQIPRPFGRITVRENVLAAARNPKEDVDYYLSLVGLEAKRDELAYKLSFPERRKLEIARALAAKPRLMLLDEVMAGLNPTEAREMVGLIKRLHKETNVAIMWVEHVMDVIMEAADRLVVLHQGQKLMEGSPREVAADERVIEVYLGERYVFKGEGGQSVAG